MKYLLLLYTLATFAPETLFGQSMLELIRRDWNTFNLFGAAEIKLPPYIKQIKSNENEIQFSRRLGDGSLNREYRESVFFLWASHFDASPIEQDSLRNWGFANMANQIILDEAAKAIKENVQSLLGPYGVDVVKIYSPKAEQISSLNLDYSNLIKSVTSKVILKSRSDPDPYMCFIMVIPNGKVSLMINFLFSAYDADFWLDEMRSMTGELILKRH